MSAAVTEDSSVGIESGGGIWPTITKPLSVLQKMRTSLIVKYIVNLNQAPPPPTLPISSPAPSQQRADINDLHPITMIMREQELGRAIITFAVPIAVAVLICGDPAILTVARVVAVDLMTGCMAIWNGILFRTNFPRLANVLEQVGVSLVLLSLCGLIASFLPKWFSCILWLSGASCLAPLLVLDSILCEVGSYAGRRKGKDSIMCEVKKANN